ncbi:DUF2280 domain-containing protein [Enterobacter kobei]|nr:DUF2280 domain-containing protein [Enterobacter kobei]
MAALKVEIKAWLFRMLHAFTPSLVGDSVLKDFGIQITRQQVRDWR